MRVYLVQHGEAVSKEENPDRPLSEKGASDVRAVGHLPHLERLASLLLCGEADRRVVTFRNAGIICLEKNEASTWHLNWAFTPDLLVQR